MARIWVALVKLDLLRRALPGGGTSKTMGAAGQHAEHLALDSSPGCIAHKPGDPSWVSISLPLTFLFWKVGILCLHHRVQSVGGWVQG